MAAVMQNVEALAHQEAQHMAPCSRLDARIVQLLVAGPQPAVLAARVIGADQRSHLDLFCLPFFIEAVEEFLHFERLPPGAGQMVFAIARVADQEDSDLSLIRFVQRGYRAVSGAQLARQGLLQGDRPGALFGRQIAGEHFPVHLGHLPVHFDDDRLALTQHIAEIARDQEAGEHRR